MDDIPVSIDPASRKFIPLLRSFMRKKGLAYATEKTYIYWIVYYIRYHSDVVNLFITHQLSGFLHFS